jgi:zinc/manganese transport system substrate-binding protein
MSRRAVLSALVALALGLFLLTGCGSSSSSSGGTIDVVAGTNVWGNIAAQIGGDRVTVRSILTDPNADPHLFESDVRAAAAVAKARLVIANGLGYDDFLGKLLSAGHRRGMVKVTVADIVHAPDNANEHLWYSPAYALATARAIAAALEHLDPAGVAMYRQNLATFESSETQVTAVIDRIKATYNGAPVAYTEPVPGYLIEAAGLHLGTPAGFSRALAEGTDPTPSDSSAFEHALTAHTVRALLYNSQVTDAETKRLKNLAEQGGVPIVGVSETLPHGQNYQQWQAAQARALLTALGASAS